MAQVKTAISLQEDLFRQADSMAREMKISRSRLFAAALEEFVRRHDNRSLLRRINEAYKEEPDGAERRYLGKMRKYHRKVLRDQW